MYVMQGVMCVCHAGCHACMSCHVCHACMSCHVCMVLESAAAAKSPANAMDDLTKIVQTSMGESAIFFVVAHEGGKCISGS